jgi:hypothetical protein
MFEPMKPAAPVTTMYMVLPYNADASSARVTTAVPSLPTTMPARDIGDANGLGPVGPGGEHDGQRGDDGVAGAGNVEHLARLRGLMVGFLIGKQRHALFAARHQQRFEPEFAAQHLRLGGEFGFGRPATDDFAQFRAIRRNHRRAGVPGVVVPPSDRPAPACRGRGRRRSFRRCGPTPPCRSPRG